MLAAAAADAGELELADDLRPALRLLASGASASRSRPTREDAEARDCADGDRATAACCPRPSSPRRSASSCASSSCSPRRSSRRRARRSTTLRKPLPGLPTTLVHARAPAGESAPDVHPQPRRVPPADGARRARRARRPAAAAGGRAARPPRLRPLARSRRRIR